MRNIPGETQEECAQRLRQEYDQYVVMLWDDNVGYLSARFSISEETAQKLLEDAR
jgi:hypothetical protein